MQSWMSPNWCGTLPQGGGHEKTYLPPCPRYCVGKQEGAGIGAKRKLDKKNWRYKILAVWAKMARKKMRDLSTKSFSIGSEGNFWVFVQLGTILTAHLTRVVGERRGGGEPKQRDTAHLLGILEPNLIWAPVAGRELVVHGAEQAGDAQWLGLHGGGGARLPGVADKKGMVSSGDVLCIAFQK